MSGSSLVVQQIKDLASCCGLGLIPGLGTSNATDAAKKKKRKEKKEEVWRSVAGGIDLLGL